MLDAVPNASVALDRPQVSSIGEEARYRDMADLASEWFWELDVDRRFAFVSEGIAEGLGVPAADFIGRRFADLPGVKVAADAGIAIGAVIGMSDSATDAGLFGCSGISRNDER